ncbi:hypothetical protein GUJ93_ZPchr0015g6711 [Zizania palustris]|uniref:Uncharacterized protein n=1 Tax=Zizania palustris TaxID=103762 RepID=A0A8J5T976_ZIZPA|nr:hypothetical protein GUJ93_ZPchr0015g6711 [Zizania palustris]
MVHSRHSVAATSQPAPALVQARSGIGPHPMQTRAKDGIEAPVNRYGFSISTLPIIPTTAMPAASPIPKSYMSTLKDP